MKHKTSLRVHVVAALVAASTVFIATAHSQSFPVLLFSDDFTTAISPPGDTTDLNTNIGSAGGRQSGLLVDGNPVGFAYDVFGQTAFGAGNGWDLRAQENWPAAGPVDAHTLRFRHNAANDWSSVSPQIGFNTFFMDNSYRFQVQIVHAHLDPTGINDRWAGIVFGAQPQVRFPAFAANAGVIITPSGAVTAFADGAAIGSGTAAVPANGVFNLDLRVVDNVGEVYINGSSVAAGLDFSLITPAVVSLVALPGTNPDVFGATQIRFDDFAVSTIPEPSVYAVAAGLLILGAASRRHLTNRAR